MTELEARIETLERAITDGEHDLSELASEAEALDRLETLETKCKEFEHQLAELDAATQALRGYVGSIRAVNSEVEQRADAALAAVESLENRLDEPKNGLDSAETQRAAFRNETTNKAQYPEPQRETQSSQQKQQVDCCDSCGRPQQSASTREKQSPSTQSTRKNTHQPGENMQSASAEPWSDQFASGVAVSDGGATARQNEHRQEKQFDGVGTETPPDESTAAKKDPGTLSRIRELL